MAHTIAVLSQKGGTGKTTAVRTLADALRRAGLRTLAVDLDPQGNLSDYFDLSPDVQPTIAEVLAGSAAVSEAIHEDIIPANLSLAEAELMLSGKMGRELTLRRALAKLPDDYDLVLIDCPRSPRRARASPRSAPTRTSRRSAPDRRPARALTAARAPVSARAPDRTRPRAQRSSTKAPCCSKGVRSRVAQPSSSPRRRSAT